MAVVQTYKINNIDRQPPRDWQDLEIEATFDNDSIQPNISLSNLNFVDDANTRIIGWLNSTFGVAEGIPIELGISDGSTTLTPLKGHLDWHSFSIKSPVECEMSIVKDNGLNSFDNRAQGITMYLLESKGIMPKSLGSNIPYVVENRKTLLENLHLVTSALITAKSGIDEIFKFINISADVTTLGAVQAFINLAQTILGLVVIKNNLTRQLIAIQKSLFPFVRYFRGIKLKTFLEKGCEYLDYDIDFGTLNDVIENVILCPSQTQEVEGLPVGFLGSATDLFQNNISGILSPKDFGYTLSEAFELCNKLFYTKIAIKDNTVHCKPFIDPYWVNSPSYVMPNVLVETTPFYTNGIKSYNISDIKSRILIEYAYDDSDKHTISNVNNSTAEIVVEPLFIGNTRHSTFRGIDNVQIPYSLAVRKNFADELWETFQELSNLNNETVQNIKDKFEDLQDILGDSLESDNPFILQVSAREGAMKVENHFFSTPKIVYLEYGKIPTNFTDKVGANALYNNYHKYKSFVPFVKNPINGNDTNQRELYTEVKIPFTINDFNTISDNSYFTDVNGNIGKFTSIKWAINKDYATVNYYLCKNYLTNIKETLI